MSESIVEIIERPYLMDGMKVYSYGEQREDIVRCGECSLCKESAIFDDEGNAIGVKHECARPFMFLQRGGMVKSALSPLNGMIVVLQQVRLDGFCAWGKRREDA